MGWKYTGGGYYENEETGERIRGKANLPLVEEEVVKEPESEAKPKRRRSSAAVVLRLPCMTCHRVTVHTPRPTESQEWAFYTCSECNGKTRVSLR